MRVAIDTNVLVSGMLGSPTCRRILSWFAEGKFILVISDVLLGELKFVLKRPFFQFLVDAKEKEELIESIESLAVFAKPRLAIALCRDPQDNKILECAIEAKADCIVSGDKDLLSLKAFPIRIVSPRDFLSLIEK